MASSHQHLPWEVLGSRSVYSAPPWIELSVQQVKLPNGRIVSDYHQIRLPDYCVIFAETVDAEVVVLRQYRHGVGRVTLSLPAGLMETGESAIESARRELFEETGYQGDQWFSLGSYVPNSNYGCGRAHLFKAVNARLVGTPDSGDLEHSELLLLSRSELLRAVNEGSVLPMSVVTTIALATNGEFKPALVERSKASDSSE